MTEPEALCRQALDDLNVFRALLARDQADVPRIAECQALHALQMAGEKLAKAVLYAADRNYRASGGERKQSHVALSKLATTLADRAKVASALGMDLPKFNGCLKQFHSWFKQFEQLQPQLAGDGPNVEYPWQDGDRWIAPCDHSFGLAARLRKGEGAQSLRFLGRLAEAVPALLE